MIEDQSPFVSKAEIDEKSVNPTPVETHRTNNFLTSLLSVLLIASVGVAGFFAYQSQRLSNELLTLKGKPVTQVDTPKLEEVGNTESTPISVDTTLNWKSYSDTNNGFSVKYPSTWRIVSMKNTVGFGPVDIPEDVIWAVTSYDSKSISVDKIIDELGSQFSDRKQATNKISINGVEAIQVITTTPSYPDWHLETIIAESSTRIITISNGAVDDSNLQKLMGVLPGTVFKDFYSTLKFTD